MFFVVLFAQEIKKKKGRKKRIRLKEEKRKHG